MKQSIGCAMTINIEESLKHNKSTYDALAHEYDEKTSAREPYNRATIERFLKSVHGKKILDIGCAVGMDSAIFSEKGYDVTGLDYSEEMIKLAKKRDLKSRFVCAEFLSWQSEERFDGIFVQSFIHLFDKPTAMKALQKIKTLLSPRGVAIIATNKSEETKEGLFAKDNYKTPLKRFRRFWTTKELEEALLSTGFKIIDQWEAIGCDDIEFIRFVVEKSR